MKQIELNHYSKLLNEVMSEYLAACPDPYDASGLDHFIKERDSEPRAIPLTWFDVAAATSLILHHKDLKDQYDVHPSTIELISMLFRMANEKLGWLDVHDADALASYLTYDSKMTKDYMKQLHELVFCITRFPYDNTNLSWYACLMPLLACFQKKKFTKSAYIGRYLNHTICKFGLVTSRGEHQRDIDTDFLRCIPQLAPLMRMVKEYAPDNDVERYTLYRNVLSEYATIYLGCLLQRSAVIEDIGVLAKEVVAQHHIEYQLLEKAYNKQAGKIAY